MKAIAYGENVRTITFEHRGMRFRASAMVSPGCSFHDEYNEGELIISFGDIVEAQALKYLLENFIEESRHEIPEFKKTKLGIGMMSD